MGRLPDGQSFTAAKHTWKWSWVGPTDEFSFCHKGLFKMPFATAAAVMKSWERLVSLYSLRKLTSYIFKHWIINDDVSDHNNVTVVTNDVQRITGRSDVTTCTINGRKNWVPLMQAKQDAVPSGAEDCSTYESFTNLSQDCHPTGKALVRSRASSCRGCCG